MLIPIEKIKANPTQPRKLFDQAELDALAESIKLHGLINPISVEEEPGGTYIIIDGERRWRAARIAGLTELKASVRPGLNGSGELSRLILGVVANLQRSDLNAVDKARAYNKLQIDGLSTAEISRVLGVSQSHVLTQLQILILPDAVIRMIEAGKLTPQNQLIAALAKMQPDLADRVARIAVTRKLTGEEAYHLATRMANLQKANPRHTKEEPTTISRTGGKNTWSISVLVPIRDQKLQAAADKVCKKCVLFEEAGVKQCSDCPAVQLAMLLSI